MQLCPAAVPLVGEGKEGEEREREKAAGNYFLKRVFKVCEVISSEAATENNL